MRVPLAFNEIQPPPAWRSGYRCEWGIVVGRRVRSLRLKHDLTIYDLSRELKRADGRPYSPSFVSRLERGWASPPLYTYIRLANRFEVGPGELLGPDGIERTVSEAELTLVRVLRRMGVSPEDALARLATPA